MEEFLGGEVVERREFPATECNGRAKALSIAAQ
jgi:hypothetical protein